MIIALNEVASLTGDVTYRKEALELLDRTLGWIKTPGSLGREALEGTPELRPLNVPMIILNVIGELSVVSTPAGRFNLTRFETQHTTPFVRLQGLTAAEDAAFYAEEKKWCAEEIRAHIISTGEKVQYVLENIGIDGKPAFDVIDGRVINPGHAIEAGWFLLDYGNKYHDATAKSAALAVIDWGLEYGVDDSTHGGGIIYFKDAEGYTPRAYAHTL
jgi:N-acylglucosamine 2-epimerase